MVQENVREVSLSGNIVPDSAKGPVLVDTISFSDFVASGNIVKSYSNKLSRNSKKRLFIIKNNLNQPISTLKIALMDSTVYVGGSVAGDLFTATSVPLIGNSAQYGSSANPILIQPCDSFVLIIGMGATAPTIGDLFVYVVEVL